MILLISGASEIDQLDFDISRTVPSWHITLNLLFLAFINVA
jgi:hypothetical protein